MMPRENRPGLNRTGIDEIGTLSPRVENLTTLYENACRSNPAKTAIIAEDQPSITYSELERQISRLGNALSAHWQIQPQEIVGLYAPNCPEFVVSYFSIVGQRLIVQPIDPRLTSDEVRTLLRDSGCRRIIVHRSLWSRFAEAYVGLTEPFDMVGIGMTPPGGESWDDLLERAPEEPGHVPAAEDVAELMYTSGTTAEPKGVMRSHRNVCAAAGNSVRGFGYHKNDTILVIMPMSHSSALNSQMIPLLGLGGTVVLMERFEVDAVIKAIRHHRVTCMRAVPAMLTLLLASPEFSSQNLPTLRLIVNSSAPVMPRTLLELKTRFPRMEVANSYGLTEASTCTVLPDADAIEHPDSVGIPIGGVEMMVLDAEGNPVPDGIEGEICVRGQHVFAGYLHRPAETAAAFIGGWLKTGDYGRRTADGFYYLTGRESELINCGGRKVSPIEIEECILQIEGIAEAAVVPAAHRTLGQVAHAFIVPAEGMRIGRREVLRHCVRNLANYKVPFGIDFVDSLPRNSLGKVIRRRLEG